MHAWNSNMRAWRRGLDGKRTRGAQHNIVRAGIVVAFEFWSSTCVRRRRLPLLPRELHRVPEFVRVNHNNSGETSARAGKKKRKQGNKTGGEFF